MERERREGPEIRKRHSPEEIDQLIWQKQLALVNSRAGLATARTHFYAYERSVEDRIEEVNELRAQRNLEPLPSEMLLDLDSITGEIPEDLRRLERRITEVERTFDLLVDAQAALGEYHLELSTKRDELLGSQKLQTLVDEEGGPDQSL